MLAMAVKNLESSGVPPISAAEGIVGRMVVPRHVFADMVAESGKMQIVDAMDLFEQIVQSHHFCGAPSPRRLVPRQVRNRSHH